MTATEKWNMTPKMKKSLAHMNSAVGDGDCKIAQMSGERCAH